jgi:hypothetical protein
MPGRDSLPAALRPASRALLVAAIVLAATSSAQISSGSLLGEARFTLVQGDVARRPQGPLQPFARQSSLVLEAGVASLPADDYRLLGTVATRLGREIFFSRPGIARVILTVGSTAVREPDGNARPPLPADVTVVDGRAFIPIRAVELLGYTVGYDAALQEITVDRGDGGVYAIGINGLVRSSVSGYEQARVRDEVFEGDSVRTREGRAEINFAGNAIIRLDRNTELVVRAYNRTEAGPMSFLVSLGRTWQRIITPRQVEVEGAAAVAAAKGTAWDMITAIDALGRTVTICRVYAGEVVVTAPGVMSRTMTAGDEYVAIIQTGEVVVTPFDLRQAEREDEWVRFNLELDRRAGFR